MPESEHFVFNEPGMYQEFHSWSGDTGRFISKKSMELESLARISAGFDTGRLIASINTEYTSTPTGDLESHVGANPSGIEPIGYAYWHHEGTWPHWIHPKRVGGVLRFVSRGMVVYARSVWHPGTTPVKYLTRWFRDLF